MGKNKKTRKNKKGSLQDILFLALAALIIAVVALISFKVSNTIDTHIQTDDNIESHGKAASTAIVNLYPGVIDNSYLFLIVGMGIIILVLAALVRIHPIFIPFYFIGLTFYIFLSGVFSNIYQALAANSSLAAEASQLTFIGLIMTALPFVIGVFGTILMVVMYKIWRADIG